MIYLDVACNDPDNGYFAGRAPLLTLGYAEFESKFFDRFPKFVELDTKVRLAGKSWNCDWSKDWVGNWCWNRYRLNPPTVEKTHRWYLVDFVKWLRGRKLYHCSTATSDFFEWFNEDVSKCDAQIHTMVCDLED